MNRYLKNLTVFFSVISLLFLATGFASAAGTSNVLVLPFKMNAPQDMTYLQEGIHDMLSSRLAWEGRVNVLPKSDARIAYNKVKGDLNEESARSAAKDFKADYVVFGSVTVIGQNVSLDAELLNLKDDQPPVKVSTQSQGLDGVIPQVNKFAETINAKIFGRSGSTVTAGPVTTGQEFPGSTPDYRRHPDYLLTGKEGRVMSPLNPNFIIASGSESDEGKFWRSPSFAKEIIGLVVGDIDFDGKNEIVYATTQEVKIMRVDNGVTQELGEFKGMTTDQFLTVDMLDVNGNGRPEIFISNQRQFTASSYALEFDNGQLIPVVVESPYYFRVINTPLGPRLIGQKGGNSEFFFGGVSFMRASAEGYSPDQPIVASKDINVFNFTTAILDSPDQEQTLFINNDDKLVVQSTSGQEIWSSREKFGMTSIYIKKPQTGMAAENESRLDWERYYIPSRIQFSDMNEDGKPEILVAKNDLTRMAGIFNRWRNFEQGSVYSLRFVESTIRENWRSKDIPGDLVDYQVVDYDNNGINDLVVAAVLKQGSGSVVKPKSTIMAYELATAEQIREFEKQRDGEN